MLTTNLTLKCPDQEVHCFIGPQWHPFLQCIQGCLTSRTVIHHVGMIATQPSCNWMANRKRNGQTTTFVGLLPSGCLVPGIYMFATPAAGLPLADGQMYVARPHLLDRAALSAGATSAATEGSAQTHHFLEVAALPQNRCRCNQVRGQVS